ncbi:RagB/SusD family nutrient uptake outer membrane protein [Chitinophaga alhagiae]|uniref:RagB/SusD family nutrient uptake outer membrane protein n=1 Tax=Chitinophaga alhagiae TaxID=2203219 RepID=UPI000E5AB93E|nr:RagB/SusD family nutrient uptake outer membrane protein [Chitinophaga alhagiae]
MNQIKHIIFALAVIISFGSCKDDFLQKDPLDQVSEDVFFSTTSDLMLYVNQFYNPGNRLLDFGSSGGLNYNRTVFALDLATDNFINASVSPLLNGTRVVPASGGGWDYSLVRKVNYFFENYEHCKDPFDSYKQYVGEAYFFRALIYYKLLRTFGDVQWFSKVLDTNSPELMNPRTPRNVIADSILADLDKAALYMTAEKTSAGLRPNKWVALALQSRIALYEGSWEKYHAGTPFGVNGANPDKYFTKAAEAAGAVMESGRFQLYATGKPDADYYNLFVLPDYAANSEVLLWKKFDKGLGIVNYRSVSSDFPDGTGITKGLADSYLCKDGRPIATSPQFGGHGSLAAEMKDRDPRYAQTIFSPGMPWEIKGTDTTTWNQAVYAKLFNSSEYSTPTGYVIRKGYSAEFVNHDLSGGTEPVIFFRYGEVLLNYAEAKAELGQLTQAEVDRSIKLLRDRVGMPNLNVSAIEVDPDWDFPGLSPLINEVRRERRVELSLVGFRWDDIARWAAADEYIAGKRPKGIFYGEQFTKNPYPDDADGFMDPYQSPLPNGYGFQLNRDYLSPLPQTELTLNPALTQNPGWVQ